MKIFKNVRAYLIPILLIPILFTETNGKNLRLSASTGYGIPLGCTGADIGDAFWELNEIKYSADGKIAEFKEIYFSGGKGLKGDLILLWDFKPDISAFLSSGYSFLGGASSKAMGISVNMSYIPVNIGLEFHSQPFFKYLTSYMRLSPGLYFPSTEILPIDSGYFVRTKVKYGIGFGFSGSLGTTLKINNKMALSFEINPIYAFAEQKEIKYEYADGKTKTYKFIRNTFPLPPNQDSDSLSNQIIYEGAGKRISFSSLSIRCAITYPF